VGNLLIFLGPSVFNSYAEKLAKLRPGLYVVEAALLLIFLTHIYYTALIVLENIRARSQRYLIYKVKEPRSFATKLMPFTGAGLLAFVIWHILDFTFVDKMGPNSMINGEWFGLYGIVYNSFLDPLHAFLYLLAMGAVGFHLAHGVQSFFQTFGFNHPRYTPLITRLSVCFGIFITAAFSSIPVLLPYLNYKYTPC
jgi:succinate dehydrogenase / fumarate reductase cytochrome b subunit